MGNADGRVLAYSTSTHEAALVAGDGHTSLVSGLTPDTGGQLYSIGYDDRVREIHANKFSCVSLPVSGPNAHA